MSEKSDRDDFLKLAKNQKNMDQNLQAYLIESIDDLRKSTTKSSDVANNLSKKIVWLNIVLTIATAIAAFATVWMVFCK